jgi:NAD(P)-dependent dehydrogenase (short-subunit alcohol dehydrogenase family)
MSQKRIVLITGAGSGIGFDTACRFLESGVHVIGCDRSEAGLLKLKDYASSNKSEYDPLVLDVSQVKSFKKVEDIVASLGRLDVLINCAGIVSGTPLDKITEEEWDKMYSVNLKGPFFLTKILIPYLIKGKKPTIINISSMAGFTGGIMSNPAYSSSKAAVTCMTKNLAKFCAPFGIRVNEVSPGTAKTPMTENWLGEEGLKDFISRVPLGRLAVAEDVAKVIVFLASDAAGFITGQTIHVNGGMYIP